VDGLKDRTITYNRRRPGETVSRSLQIDRLVHRAGIELRRRRDVLIGARDVPGDGLAEAVAVEVDVDAGLLHAVRPRRRRPLLRRHSAEAVGHHLHLLAAAGLAGTATEAQRALDGVGDARRHVRKWRPSPCRE
jgi:hypothetical protein